MQVHLYCKCTHKMDECDPQVWGTYKEYTDFWYITMDPISEKLDNKIKPIPLSIFEAKQVQKEHKNENTIIPFKYWIKPAN